jgi:hypothetical protein
MAAKDHGTSGEFDAKLKALHDAYFERDAAKSGTDANLDHMDALNERVETALREFMAVCDQID